MKSNPSPRKKGWLLKETDIFFQGGRIRAKWGWEIGKICAEISHDRGVSYYGSMMTTEEHRWFAALDGRCTYRGGWGGGVRGWELSGRKLRRYVLYRLNAEQPSPFPEEEAVPSFEQLEEELARQWKIHRP